MKYRAVSIPTLKTRRKDGLILLRDASSDKRDQKIDSRKSWGNIFAAALLSAGLDKAAARVRDCAEALFFEEVTDQSTAELALRLYSAPFCKYRHCPICQWRRSLKVKATLMSALPAILEQHPTARFLFLTLTVRNCDLSDLRETIQAMNKGWKRLIQRKDWPALGWIRATEVTRGKDGSAHPHFHSTLMVPASYFSGKGYVPTREWVRRWRDAMRLDYDPVCDVRVIHPKKASKEISKGGTTAASVVDQQMAALYSAIAETAKYPIKSADLLQGGPEWLARYIEQVHALKFLTSGGAFKGIMQDLRTLGAADEDLTHYGQDGKPKQRVSPENLLAFHFRKPLNAYGRKRKGGENG